MHKYFLAQQDVRKNDPKFDKLDEDVLKRSILDGTTNIKELATLKKLEDLNLGLSKKMGSIMLKAFTLYHQLLSPTIPGKWGGIVQEHCFTVGWTHAIMESLKSENRGQDWDTLEECKYLHLLTVCKKDTAAEHHDLYINITVKKPQHVTIKTYYKRLKEINTLAPMLPCLNSLTGKGVDMHHFFN